MKHFYVMSDIHGKMRLFSEMKEYMEQHDKNYKCYVLGDMIDRGPWGYRIMKMLFSDHGKHFTYLKGDHENFFVNSAQYILAVARSMHMSKSDALSWFDEDGFMEPILAIHIQNGGTKTIREWIKDGMRQDIVDYIENLPLRASVGMVDMCHAGCSLNEWERNDEDAQLWSRNHYDEFWFFDRFLIHGHTPTRILRKKFEAGNKSDHPLFYKENKLCIDAGTSNTNVAYLIDVNTEEQVYKYQEIEFTTQS